MTKRQCVPELPKEPLFIEHEQRMGLLSSKYGICTSHSRRDAMKAQGKCSTRHREQSTSPSNRDAMNFGLRLVEEQVN